MRNYGFILLLFFAVVPAIGQRAYFYGGVTHSVPMANRDWIGKGGIGYEAGYRGFLRDGKYSLGLDLSYSILNEYVPQETFQVPGGATTTDYYRFLYTTGVTASFLYYFLEGRSPNIFPYAGLGVGGMWQKYRLYYNIYQDNDKGAGLLVRPEVGIVYKLPKSKNTGIKVSASWNLGTARSSDYEVQNYSAFSLHASLMILGY